MKAARTRCVARVTADGAALREGAAQLLEGELEGAGNAVRRGGDALKAVELVAVLGLVDELDAARTVGQHGGSASGAVGGDPF